MTLDKSISAGNIISWAIMLMGLAFGYAKIESATVQNSKDVLAATALAEKVDKSLREIDTSRQAQINSLTVDVAVLKVTANSIDKKLDTLIVQSQKP